ncbi:MAG: transglycosylase domain-containing protein, partial [Deltaproteobacteria bacterium]|nr:transglycosylase domain-containing protein [Deltaproteobacteria bacterium]
GDIEDVVVTHGAFAAAPVALTAGIRASLTIAPDSIAVAHASLDAGAIHLATSGWVRRGTPVAAQLDAHLAPAPCADLLASLPERLRGPLDGMAVSGQLGGRARLAVDLSTPPGEGVELAHAFTGACTVAAEPPAADVAMLASSSEQRLADGTRVRIGKGEPDFAELRTLPPHVAAAFVAAEDGRFWQHGGFDFEQIARSLEIDLREHRLARGGSTISQQLVKNAFLVQRRSFDRKLQEAILAWRLEQRLSKKEILERYLNIIELGPHVFGVQAAARHWFGTSARDLTVRQAAFLAALTSQPTTLSRRLRRDGTLDADTVEKIDIVLRALRRSGTIDAAGYELARTAPLRFQPTALRGD